MTFSKGLRSTRRTESKKKCNSFNDFFQQWDKWRNSSGQTTMFVPMTPE